MAKLHDYHVLCPLIDQKSFLGVSPDKDKECVIVTLGRNVVNKYRLSDQKQVSGWTSRDHITATVIYDKEQDCYVGIFNNNTIKMWKEDGDNLDKNKKYKFPINMLQLIQRGEKPSLIIFNNGNCASLPYAIDNRKSYESKSLLKDSEKIVDAACYNYEGLDYICYVVRSNKNIYEIVTSPVREELGDLHHSKLSKIKVTRPEDVDVVGEFICTIDKTLAVYVLWNDSKLTMYDLIKKSWKTLGSVPWISTSTKVSLAWMGKNNLILFGRNMDQDGAIIMIYNVILGIGSCKYPMKMYSEHARLYCFNERIILEASNHIGMLPYVLESRRNLSSLLGSHEIMEAKNTEIVNWDMTITPHFNVPDELKEYLKLGITERCMCAQVINKLLENDNVKKVLTVLKAFKDVPESVLVQLLNYIIRLLKPNVVMNQVEFKKFIQESEKTHKPKLDLLNYIFEITFSDALLIPNLRNGLSLNDSLFLMAYITRLLVNPTMTIKSEYETKLLDWCTLLMDAFYQQLLMTKDENVTVVLQNMLDIVSKVVKRLSRIDETMATLNKFMTSKIPLNEESLSYTIEMLKI